MKTETLINIKHGKVTIIKEPDAKTQSRKEKEISFCDLPEIVVEIRERHVGD